jgi:hypothetical protein
LNPRISFRIDKDLLYSFVLQSAGHMGPECYSKLIAEPDAGILASCLLLFFAEVFH